MTIQFKNGQVQSQNDRLIKKRAGLIKQMWFKQKMGGSN